MNEHESPQSSHHSQGKADTRRAPPAGLDKYFTLRPGRRPCGQGGWVQDSQHGYRAGTPCSGHDVVTSKGTAEVFPRGKKCHTGARGRSAILGLGVNGPGHLDLTTCPH